MSRTTSRSFPRPVDATLHGVTDYSVGTLLVSVLPSLLRLGGTPAGRQIRLAGAAHAGYSLLTDYPLGAVKLIPYRVHLALDAAGALTLAAAPFVTGQQRRGRRQWLPQVGLCLFELGALLLSDPTGRGDYKADLDAVREANAKDPRAAIEEPGLAVRPNSARAEASA